jgi:Sulfotransferase family
VNPYVFLVGCLRSGTTLLQRIVDAHPQIAVIHETQWVPRWYERRVGLTAAGEVTPGLVDELFEHDRFGRLDLEPAAVAGLLRDGEPLHYRRFVAELFDLHGRAKGKRLVGEKSPGYVRHIPTLHELWPEARIVHLIRDGRAVCLSARAWRKADRILGRFPTWAEDQVTTAALWWEWHVRLGREAGLPLGSDRYHEVSYEALVGEPEAECARLCEFLGVPYDDAMLRFHEGRTRARPGLSAKAAWRPVTPGLRDWAREMPARDVERFEAASGPLLAELGYPRAVPVPAEEDVERAERLRREFADSVRARKRPLPAEWTERVA